MGINYSSAIIDFLDRDSQKISAMAYPVSKITLNNFIDNKVIPFKTFKIVNNKWVECEIEVIKDG